MTFPLTWLLWPVSVFPWPKGGVALSVESDGLPQGGGETIDRRELDAGHRQFAGNHSHVPCLPFRQLLLYPSDIMLLYPSDSCCFTLLTATSLPFQQLLLYPSDSCCFTVPTSCIFTLLAAASPPFLLGFLLFRWLPPNCSFFLLGFYLSDSCFPTVHSSCWVFTLLTAAYQLFTLLVGFLPF